YPPRTLAALYLLTYDYRLWYHWHSDFAEQQAIDWQTDRPTGPGWDAYYLAQAARDIAGNGRGKTTLSDLVNRADYPHDVLRLIITALAIARNDPKEVKETVLKKGRFVTC
ncbi:MAG: hypothetical protein FWF60_07990, partial [Oscillospiraceae bacterium]|nr:hypothetical protein [Oscillospiraceae bacterium]